MTGDQGGSAFRFDGGWREYAPIAFTNLLLTIVTLGIYRFWATTRTRRYLWSRTIFIDDRLEWTGTGKELFLGFLIVVALFLAPLLFLQFGMQALIIRGKPGIAGLLGLASFLLIFYLVGVARFRALRYRLGRTYWHGIRGGSDDNGLRFGLSYLWKTFVGYVALALLVPWSMMSLWNERWEKMSFGPHRFESAGDYKPAFMRWLLIYALPFLMAIMMVILGLGGGMIAATAPGQARDGLAAGAVLIVALMAIGIYAAIGLVMLTYYAVFFREAIGGLSLSTLDFQFSARTFDWFKLILGDIALVICTLGVGLIFLGYRHWKFFITHMEAYGEIDLDTLTQSTTRMSKHGEGLLDALDIGAF